MDDQNFWNIGSLLCMELPSHKQEMGSDHRSVGLFHGLRSLHLRLPEIWDGTGRDGTLGWGAGGCQGLLSLDNHPPKAWMPRRGADTAQKPRWNRQRPQENLRVHFTSCACWADGLELRSLNDFFWLSKFNVIFKIIHVHDVLKY